MTCHSPIGEAAILALVSISPRQVALSASLVAALLNRQFAEMVVAGLVITVPSIAAEEARPHEVGKEGSLVVSWMVRRPANRRRAAAASVVKVSIAFEMRHLVVFGCKAMRVCSTRIPTLHVSPKAVRSTDHVRMEKDMTAMRTGSASAVCGPVLHKESQR